MYLVGWHAGAVSLPPSDVILAQLACPLSDIMFCLHSGITNLSLYKYWMQPLGPGRKKMAKSSIRPFVLGRTFCLLTVCQWRYLVAGEVGQYRAGLESIV